MRGTVDLTDKEEKIETEREETQNPKMTFSRLIVMSLPAAWR